MSYTIHIATIQDLTSILTLQNKVAQKLTDSSYFAQESEDFFAKIIQGQGLIQLAKVQEKVIACACLYFPKENDETNLGIDLGFSLKQRQKVAHLDSAFVDLAYQGKKIASVLSQKNIDYALAQNKNYILATAHPNNINSIKNLFSLKCGIIGFAYKYDNLPRFIFSYMPEYFSRTN